MLRIARRESPCSLSTALDEVLCIAQLESPSLSLINAAIRKSVTKHPQLVYIFSLRTPFLTMHGKTMRDQKYEALQGRMQKLAEAELTCLCNNS